MTDSELCLMAEPTQPVPVVASANGDALPATVGAEDAAKARPQETSAVLKLKGLPYSTNEQQVNYSLCLLRKALLNRWA